MVNLSLVKKLYDHLVKEESLIKTNLENGNPEVHPGPTLLNVGRIDYAGEFALYKEGITKHTVRLLHAIELERLNLGRRLGFELSTAKESRIERGYLERDKEDEPLNRLFNTSPVFSQIPGPNHVESRYLTEDIAYGLVLWSSLGRVIDVPTPNIVIIVIALIIVVISMLAMLIRVVLGPSLADRVVALDAIGLQLMAVIALFSILLNIKYMIVVIMMIGILAFLGTAVFSKFMDKGKVIEHDQNHTD
ncbi:Na(+)/H(+) antiporter subunit F1 [Bacillus sp. SD-4]|nr:Na(+)/H(+) antiporter subunit F1 [Bacillus sp. SD-4]